MMFCDFEPACQRMQFCDYITSIPIGSRSAGFLPEFSDMIQTPGISVPGVQEPACLEA